MVFQILEKCFFFLALENFLNGLLLVSLAVSLLIDIYDFTLIPF